VPIAGVANRILGGRGNDRLAGGGGNDYIMATFVMAHARSVAFIWSCRRYDGRPHLGDEERPPRAIARSVSLERRLVSYGGIFQGCGATVP